jgi:hypothetical protein
MKHPLFTNARRPVLSCRVAKLASGPPGRACIASERTSRGFAVRGSALPGLCARRCSPPTAMPTASRIVRKSIALVLSREWKINTSERQQLVRRAELKNFYAYHGTDWTNSSFVNSEMRQMFIAWQRTGRSAIRRVIHDHIWPKPPPCAVNVLLALFPLRSTLTAAAFRPRLLLGSGFGKFKAGALSSHVTHLLLNAIRRASASAFAMEHAAAAVDASIRLLKLNRWLVRLSGHVLPQLAIICTSFPLPFAFRVCFLLRRKGVGTFAARSLSWTLRVESGCFCALAPRGAPQLLAPRIGPRSIAVPFSRRCCAGCLDTASAGP